MDPSSNDRHESGQHLPPRAVQTHSSLREYRRHRRHLYPLDGYLAARRVGGTVRTYCGVDVRLAVDEPVELADVDGVGAEDCVTCVDIWRGRDEVRL